MALICASLSACGNIDSMGNSYESVTLYNDYSEYETAKDIVEAADYIFTGTIEKTTYQEMLVTEEGDIENYDPLLGDKEIEDAIPYTIYDIKIAKVYKGQIHTEKFQIKRAGGEFDGNKVYIDGTVPINSNQDYLFLVKEFNGTIPSLVNLSQSVYKLNEPNNEDINNDKNLNEILELLE